MGMYDYVNYECQCPVCRSGVMRDFQSKDGERMLIRIEPKNISNFYSHCSICGAFVEFIKQSDGKWLRRVSKRGEVQKAFDKSVSIN